jgi:hypothetical protein
MAILGWHYRRKSGGKSHTGLLVGESVGQASAGDRIARVGALKEDISEQLRDSYRNRAHVRFGAPRHHAGPTKRKGAHEPQRSAHDGGRLGCDVC